MEKIVDLGLAKSIGVSNFAIEDLQDIWGVARIKSMVYQNEFKAFLQNQTPAIVEFCRKNEFRVTAYSPLGPITRTEPGEFHASLSRLASVCDKTPEQILLRWMLQKIPKFCS